MRRANTLGRVILQYHVLPEEISVDHQTCSQKMMRFESHAMPMVSDIQFAADRQDRVGH